MEKTSVDIIGFLSKLFLFSTFKIRFGFDFTSVSNSHANQIFELLLFVSRSYGLKIAQDWPKISLFNKVSATVFFGRVSPLQTFFYGYDSYIYISTQLRAPFLKVLSYVHHICRTEDVKVTENEHKLTTIDHTNTFAETKVPQNIVKRSFFLYSNMP